jgi:hypothetical protein
MTMFRPYGIRRLSGCAALAVQFAAVAIAGDSARAVDAPWSNPQTPSVLVADAGDGDDGAERSPTSHSPADTIEIGVSCTTNLYGIADSCTDTCACDTRTGGACHHDRCGEVRDCDPPGLFQRLGALHDKSGACWSGRADALLLWRNAPPDRPIVEGGIDGFSSLNANGMDSTPAAGPRFSLFRTDRCGDAWEVTWLRAANFRSIRPLPVTDQQYVLSPPGLYGNSTLQPFDSGTANLGSRVQSFELNHHRCHGKHIRWLAGFRWVEWQEQFTLQDTVTTTEPVINDFYQTGCINSMYGGQIGADLYLFSLPWLRVDSVVKAGAYYNNASQASEYTTNDPGFPGTAAVTVGQSPASCAFVGEVGMTGTMPITSIRNSVKSW